MFPQSSFQILAALLSKCYQHHRTTSWKMRMVWGKNILHECVACVCLMFGTLFLAIAFFMAIGFFMGVMTISFALPTDLYKSLWNSKNG